MLMRDLFGSSICDGCLFGWLFLQTGKRKKSELSWSVRGRTSTNPRQIILGSLFDNSKGIQRRFSLRSIFCRPRTSCVRVSLKREIYKNGIEMNQYARKPIVDYMVRTRAHWLAEKSVCLMWLYRSSIADCRQFRINHHVVTRMTAAAVFSCQTNKT